MGLAHFFNTLLGRKARVPREQVMKVFKRRYVSFKDLLQSNTDLANILAALDAALRGNTLYGLSQVRAEAAKAVFHAMRMASSLNAMAGNRYSELEGVVEAINKRITAELEERPPLEVHAFTLPLSEVQADHADAVGGKSANLGELLNVAGMPVPRGFAVTTAAYTAFVRHGDMLVELRKKLRHADPADPESIVAVAKDVASMLEAAPLPEDVEHALLEAWDQTFGPAAGTARTALRSSAVAEDGCHSFAGQYRTVLGVRRDTLAKAFKQVIASLFSPRAITYRLCHGYIFEEIAMAMCCVEMVDARAAGVAFSRHPVDLRSEAVVVNGLWGLGELLVDGEATPDAWLVSRDNTILESKIVQKDVLLRLHDEDGCTQTRREAVPEPLRASPCLSEAEVLEIAAVALALEEHYRHPQDVEWAVDQEGRLLLLQSRPMHMADARNDKSLRESALSGYTVLLDGGDIAASGVGCGPLCHVESEEDMRRFPGGGILLTRHSSPNMVVAMERAQAIIAETGSLTGHMASICREFNVPTLLNLKGATALEEGRVVTVDALSGRVYDGKVEELLALRSENTLQMDKTPVHALLTRVASHITPLHLVDPKSALFAPRHCTTLHDVMRFVHEQSYSEMFRLSDNASEVGSVAVQLRCKVPLDLCVIDLGQGLQNPEVPFARPEDVLSLPFRSLLSGMLNPEVQARGPRPVDMSGFLSVMSQSMVGGNGHGGERFGDRSYAIISDRYMNFSSRVGYHYAILDAWCGDTMNKNYISFKFAGGAADEVRRGRRVRCIGMILERLNFHVDVVMDRVQARIQKYPRADMEPRLDQLGRLLIMTRQMDMLMINEEAIGIFADKFMRGEYH